MTILENARVEIKKERKKKATTTIKPPPIYHCNISWVVEQGPVMSGERRKRQGAKRQHISDSLKPSEELEI